MADTYPRMARFKMSADFRGRIQELGLHLPFDEEVLPAPGGPLAQPYVLKDGRWIGNRFCIHPMEGWDGTTDGKPSERTIRRWRNFGLSGAKLIWGGEATAVRADGRANPNQLMILENTKGELAQLRQVLVDEHRAHFGSDDDLLVGLQLTHSGRFCRPNVKTKLEPMILYHHPLLDPMFKIPADYPVMTDAEIEDLIADYVRSARRAQEIGFDFVDIKHCHGYLGHEFLSAFSRAGIYGGSFENRTRFLREIVRGIRRECPGLRMGVRLSMLDLPPFKKGPASVGEMVDYRDAHGQYPYAFSGDPQYPERYQLTETVRFLALLEELGVNLVNLTAASPYYNPHVTRPAYFPPSDGYQPPEDPLVGVARHINAAAELKSCRPGVTMVGSGYTYLQEWLPNVAQHAVRTGMIDFVGIGRMVLSYPDFPADVLSGKPLARTRICRTFSDCTTAPRCGLVSGCYPLDEFYKQSDEMEKLRLKKGELEKVK